MLGGSNQLLYCSPPRLPPQHFVVYQLTWLAGFLVIPITQNRNSRLVVALGSLIHILSLGFVFTQFISFGSLQFLLRAQLKVRLVLFHLPKGNNLHRFSFVYYPNILHASLPHSGIVRIIVPSRSTSHAIFLLNNPHVFFVWMWSHHTFVQIFCFRNCVTLKSRTIVTINTCMRFHKFFFNVLQLVVSICLVPNFQECHVNFPLIFNQG